jgi:hypothetical protein
MTQTVEQRPCPLCHGPATSKFMDHNDKRYYRCPECVGLVIGMDAEKRLAGQQALAGALSTQAREAPADSILLVVCDIVRHADAAAFEIVASIVTRKSLGLG